jgi:hypothetical protein
VRNTREERRQALYNIGMPRGNLRAAVLLIALGVCRTTTAQTPAPFPRPGEPQRTTPQSPPTARPAPPPSSESSPGVEPNEQTLGTPVYPGAEFIASYNAGRGQRYYIFGTNATFLDIVNYYKSVLKQRGELVYDEPPIHMFEIGRFREETMAFPPGVTVKDYTWGGSLGYLNPKRGAQPARFKTIIQVVPVVTP